MGRVVRPMQASAGKAERTPMLMEIVDGILRDPAFAHVYFDISWNEVAKYVVATPQSLANTVTIIERYPDRTLFGTDEVAPRDLAQYLSVYETYGPLWERLSPATRAKVTRGNYERLFDAARVKVRAWEQANVH
jgi:hypothetical protein